MFFSAQCLLPLQQALESKNTKLATWAVAGMHVYIDLIHNLMITTFYIIIITDML